MAKMTAVITGGTGGIGTAICQRLAQDYQVVACYFKQGKHEEAKRWQADMREEGFNVDIEYADIGLFADCEKLVSHTLERFGKIDVLVNNAGIIADSSLKKMTEAQWDTVMKANLDSVFNMTRNVLPSMIENHYGRIISISSINGRKGQFGQCNYAATKSALYGFSKSLALEVADKGITVNTISPGYIDTPMLAGMHEDVLQKMIAQIPVGRLGKPEEIAASVFYLASKDAEFITGTNLDINGGQYMGS